ncbi:MAG: iron transporter [Helicobacteraceae bacterium]|jgi:uncharacterized protein involved in high-affinity Fe2+ transport|nr:iron transporter [Helicobacteraceae bacterium]
MTLVSKVFLAGALAVLPSASFAADDAHVHPSEAAGFEEFPLGDEFDVGPLHIAGVYFQPVDMEPKTLAGNLAKNKADMHMEADISANKEGTKLGFGEGDFVPFLSVKYKIQKDGSKKVQEGTFMPMSASDGPHYGNNIKLDGAGTYKITFIVENPSKSSGYLLHVDKETGVDGRFWDKPIEVSWDFKWTPRKW